jgi:hypothetical protein
MDQALNSCLCPCTSTYSTVPFNVFSVSLIAVDFMSLTQNFIKSPFFVIPHMFQFTYFIISFQDLLTFVIGGLVFLVIF